MKNKMLFSSLTSLIVAFAYFRWVGALILHFWAVGGISAEWGYWLGVVAFFFPGLASAVYATIQITHGSWLYAITCGIFIAASILVGILYAVANSLSERIQQAKVSDLGAIDLPDGESE